MPLTLPLGIHKHILPETSNHCYISLLQGLLVILKIPKQYQAHEQFWSISSILYISLVSKDRFPSTKSVQFTTEIQLTFVPTE